MLFSFPNFDVFFLRILATPAIPKLILKKKRFYAFYLIWLFMLSPLFLLCCLAVAQSMRALVSNIQHPSHSSPPLVRSVSRCQFFRREPCAYSHTEPTSAPIKFRSCCNQHSRVFHEAVSFFQNWGFLKNAFLQIIQRFKRFEFCDVFV